MQGIPVNKKLPSFEVVDSSSITHLDFSQPDLLEKYQHMYLWAELLCWNYEDELPKGRILGVFDGKYKTPEVEGEVLLHQLDICTQTTHLLYPKYLKNKEYLPIKGHK